MNCDDVLDVSVPLDVRAPGAARIVVARFLRDRVAASVLDGAQRVVSELVTNSVRHNAPGAAEVVAVRVELTQDRVRLEVEDPGRDGAIAARSPNPDGGAGLGLNVVHALCERWGLECGAEGRHVCGRSFHARPRPRRRPRQGTAGRAAPDRYQTPRRSARRWAPRAGAGLQERIHERSARHPR